MVLLIVESPTKARTLSKFLGNDYKVEATMGHIKDLPKSKLGVDVEKDFEPDYQVVERQAKTIKTLISSAKKAKGIYLATDPDREGEAIAAHVREILSDEVIKKLGKADKSLNNLISRITFHEITKSAVEDAIKNPRQVDENLVNAQVARRVLDRLVGYKLSPLLWKKVRRGLSAGRVQSVAVRLIVEKEREIEAFKPVEYWEIGSELKAKKQDFFAALAKIDDKKAEVRNKDEAEKIVEGLNKGEYKVKDVKKKEVKKQPYPPFTTSTMTQAGARLFGWSAKRTMTIAQRLYEEGLITYHRTDSVNLSTQALNMARDYIAKEFGRDYLPENPRFYKIKSKNAQEAHEAIRPTDVNNKPQKENEKLDGAQKKLYDLIWRRFLACQMKESIYDQTSIDIEARCSGSVAGMTEKTYTLRSSGQVMKFDGWTRLRLKATDTGEDNEAPLPDVDINEVLQLIKVVSVQKFTQPPARFNEASLIKTLEKLGIGRPSTYAPTISTIQIRNYVEKQDGKFFATPVGVAVNDFLLKNFTETFDYGFTAQMEDGLDKVAQGKLEWKKELSSFWKPFVKKLEDVEKKAERVKIEVEKVGEMCPLCGEAEKGEKVIRIGRFGKFISCSRFPDCKFTEKYVEKIDMECPKCGEGEVIVKKTAKKRTFFGCSRYPECDWASWKNPQKEAASED